MARLDELLTVVTKHFARYTRPAQYIHGTHYCECGERYTELLAVPVDALRKEHVGDGAWDPTCALTPEGFRYYFPGMASIATKDRTWLDSVLPRLSPWYVDALDEAGRGLVRRLLEVWCLDDGTPDDIRVRIEQALRRYRVKSTVEGDPHED